MQCTREHARRMDPRDRPTADACLRHPYLAGLHAPADSRKSSAHSSAQAYTATRMRSPGALPAPVPRLQSFQGLSMQGSRLAPGLPEKVKPRLASVRTTSSTHISHRNRVERLSPCKHAPRTRRPCIRSTRRPTRPAKPSVCRRGTATGRSARQRAGGASRRLCMRGP